MNYAPIDICSGPLWNPKLWDNLNDIPHLENTNCYSYVFNYIDYSKKKVQPGKLSSNNEDYTYTCENIILRMKDDYPDVQDSYFREKLDCSRYKIALTVDTSDDNRDYHFYRQDKDGLWSHKLGTNYISRVDANNEVIINPEYCDRDYRDEEGSQNYDTFCGYFSIPNKEGPIVRGV